MGSPEARKAALLIFKILEATQFGTEAGLYVSFQNSTVGHREVETHNIVQCWYLLILWEKVQYEFYLGVKFVLRLRNLDIFRLWCSDLCAFVCIQINELLVCCVYAGGLGEPKVGLGRREHGESPTSKSALLLLDFKKALILWNGRV